jgi:DNA-binding MarR family transcriptional regulator
LSPAGRRLVPQLAALADANDAEFFAHLSAADRKALFRILRGIVAERGLTSPPIE